MRLPLRPGDFHRFGLAIETDLEKAVDWLSTTLGAAPFSNGSYGLHNFQMRDPETPTNPDDHDPTAHRLPMMWVGGMPIILFTAEEPAGGISHFLNRYGPGIHSLAWVLDDMWASESLLRRHGVRITGTDIPGRHFFMHPADTARIMIELTDSMLSGDPRDGGATPSTPNPVVEVRDIAWVTAVVKDVEASAKVLEDILDVRRLEGNGRGPVEREHTLDLAIGDAVVRLVAPQSPDSPYAAALESGGERLYSLCFGVDDLDSSLAALEKAGVGVIAGDDAVRFTDPASTLGLVFEWTDSYQKPAHRSA